MDNPISFFTHALSLSLDMPVQSTASLAPDLRQAAREANSSNEETVSEVVLGTARYLCAQYDSLSDDLLLAGPYKRPADPVDGSQPVLEEREEARLRAALESAALGLRHFVEEPRLRLELARQMELISGAIAAITSQLDLELVLRRIVDLTREVAGARYVALGVPNERDEIETFITSGMTAAQQARIGDLPVGRGLLGALLTRGQTIRLADLSGHPESAGFPPNHPPMKSFLGVPVMARGEILGNLYLTEKRFADEFTAEDERLVEVLARHAAVAIENAHLYQELQEQEQRLNFILNQLPEAVLFMEPSPSRVTMLNHQAQRLLSLDAEPPVPMEQVAEQLELVDEAGNVVPVEQRPMFRSLLAGEMVIRREVRYRTRDGSYVTYLLNSVPIFQDGRVTAALAVFQDITVIKDADQLKDDFLSLVSHELRTPLTTIHGGASMLLNSDVDLDAGTRLELLSDMHQESARLATLIQGMVQLAHVRAGRLRLETEPVLIKSVVTRCVDAFRVEAPDREFRIEVEPDLVAFADPQGVDDILRNLIQNAIKYTPESTPIDVLARPVGDDIEISVRDYGEGIPSDEIPTIFDRFQRGAGSRTGRSTGLGLGLYLVKHLVEAQGGEIGVECPADGGTRFTFSVPTALDE